MSEDLLSTGVLQAIPDPAAPKAKLADPYLDSYLPWNGRPYPDHYQEYEPMNRTQRLQAMPDPTPDAELF